MATTTARRIAAALCLGIAAGCQGTPTAQPTPTKAGGAEPRVSEASRDTTRKSAPAVASLWPEPSPPPVVRAVGAPAKSPTPTVNELPRSLSAAKATQAPALSPDAVSRVGALICGAAGLPNVTVDVLKNQRPTVERTSGGNLFISTGMLVQLRDENELAALIALQLAPQMKDDVAQPVSTQGAPVDRDLRVAARLLGQAGFSTTAAASVKERLRAKPSARSSLMAN